MKDHANFLLLVVSVMLGFSAAARATDLSLIFDPPTPSEISTVVQDWSSRTHDGTGFVVERTAEENGFTIARVSFYYEGLKQYAMLRYPRNYSPNGHYPVLIFHHGGTSGFHYTSGLEFDDNYPTGCLADECLVLVPTYRGEGFASGDILGNAVSGGEKSVWDRDCDDAMALLTAVMVAMPQADPSRLYSLGRSRGAGVAYHMALRDPRLYRSEVLFGPTDFFLESIRQDIQATLDGGPVPTNTLSIKVWDYIVSPWIAGEKSLAEARLLMIGWSSLYFVDPAVSMQIHHGQDDTNIPVSHAEIIAEAMIAAGAELPEFELFTYPGGIHHPDSLEGHEVRVEDYLCLPEGVSSVPDPMPMPALEAWPNPFARTVLIQASDLSFAKERGGMPAQVQVFDVRGRLIRSLALPAVGAVQWDGTDIGGRRVGAGIYFMEKSDAPGVPLKVLLLP